MISSIVWTRRFRPAPCWLVVTAVGRNCYSPRAEDIALHTTELALQPTGPICFDSLACLQIAFLTFEYSLQLLVLPNHHWKQCFDNNCSCDTFKCTKSACFCAESTRSRTAIFTSWVWLFPSKHLGLFFFTPKACPSGWVFSQAQHPTIKTYRIGP